MANLRVVTIPAGRYPATQMKKGKKISVLSFAKFQAVIMALVGFACGIIYSFGGLIADTLVTFGWLSASSLSTPGLSYGTLLAFGALVGMPLLGLTAGFVSGLVGALLYNVFSSWVSAATLDFEQKNASL